jgi:hypothetical protein
MLLRRNHRHVVPGSNLKYICSMSYLAIAVFCLALFSVKIGMAQARYIARDKALEICKSELATIGLDTAGWIYGTWRHPWTIGEYLKFTRGADAQLINSARRWIRGKRYWMCDAGPKGSMDYVFYIFIDARTGDVLCVIPNESPMPQEWVVRYNELQKARMKKK